MNMTKVPLPPEATTLLAQGRGRALIASSQADELSYAGKPYSAFTLALIEALAGQGVSQQDGTVRLAEPVDLGACRHACAGPQFPPTGTTRSANGEK